MKLLISQKDELYNLIEDFDYFSPSQFEIIELKQKDHDYTTEIIFKNSNYFFKIFPQSSYQGIFFANFSPGQNSVIEATSQMDWASGLNYVYEWLTYLERELTAQNKWERLFQEMKQINFVTTNDQTKFSYQEYSDLVIKMDTIKKSLDAIPLLEEQQQAIISQLNHLTELAKN